MHSSTGPGIQPISGIKKPRFERVHGEGLLFKNEILISPAGPFISKDITANNVNNVSENTRIFDILSRALYWPINNIKDHTINIPIAKSRGGKDENITIFFKRRPVTKLTAEIVKVPVINPTIKYIGKLNLLRF